MAPPRQRLQKSRAPARSLYRKIQIVLKEARRGQASSLKDLAETIYGRGHLDFRYYRARGSGPARAKACKPEAIGRIVDRCVAFGFVSASDGHLTRAGVDAADPARFDRLLDRAVTNALKRLGAPMPEIRNVIRELLRACERDALPTWDVIFQRLSEPGNSRGRQEFRINLSLLSACQGVHYTRKKIYLP